MTTAPWVLCGCCGHRRDGHGNTTTSSSECNVVGASYDGPVHCDCAAFVTPERRTPGDVLGELEQSVKPAIAAAIAEDLAAPKASS